MNVVVRNVSNFTSLPGLRSLDKQKLDRFHFVGNHYTPTPYLHRAERVRETSHQQLLCGYRELSVCLALVPPQLGTWYTLASESSSRWYRYPQLQSSRLDSKYPRRQARTPRSQCRCLVSHISGGC